MRSFLVAVPIRASKEQIWPILTHAASYSEWNPVIERLEGQLAAGGQVEVFPKNIYENRYSVTVEELSAPKRMVWKRTLPFGGLVARRTFLLRNLKDGAVEFEIREVYTGWLSRWMRRLIPDPQRSFEIFAVALKQRAEAAALVESQPVAN
jgi:hypothetical protein